MEAICKKGDEPTLRCDTYCGTVASKHTDWQGKDAKKPSDTFFQVTYADGDAEDMTGCELLAAIVKVRQSIIQPVSHLGEKESESLGDGLDCVYIHFISCCPLLSLTSFLLFNFLLFSSTAGAPRDR